MSAEAWAGRLWHGGCVLAVGGIVSTQGTPSEALSVSRRILDLMRAGGDANVGQTLLRLAALAEVAHAHEVAMQSMTDFRKDAPDAGDSGHGHGFNPMDRVGQGLRRSAGPAGAHKEVRP